MRVAKRAGKEVPVRDDFKQVLISVVIALSGGSAACSADGPSTNTEGQPIGGADSVQCGSVTCGPDEVCVDAQPLPPWTTGSEEFACQPMPTGCRSTSLCDCAAAWEDVDGKSVIGCSILGERTLFVADFTCGERTCNDDEYCLMWRAGKGEADPLIDEQCEPKPAECATNMCDSQCKATILAQEGGVWVGCGGPPSVFEIGVQ
jgi:hypothetical protein